MNQPISIPEGDEMPTFWRYLIRGWLTCHWLAFLGYLYVYDLQFERNFSGDGDDIGAAFGVQLFGMIFGVLVSLMFPGKRLKYSALFILPDLKVQLGAIAMAVLLPEPLHRHSRYGYGE